MWERPAGKRGRPMHRGSERDTQPGVLRVMWQHARNMDSAQQGKSVAAEKRRAESNDQSVRTSVGGFRWRMGRTTEKPGNAGGGKGPDRTERTVPKRGD